MADQSSAEAMVREICRKTRRRFSPEEKIRIVLEGLRGEESITECCASTWGRERGGVSAYPSCPLGLVAQTTGNHGVVKTRS
jgi:hypothetical protein